MRRIRRHAIGLFLLAACLASPAWAACRDAVVLVHGNTGSPSDFANTYAALLARGYAPDEIFRPSWGSKTCAACNDHDGSEEPPVAAALADALDRSCTGRIDVIAHSMGVTLAAREILRYGLAEDVDAFVGIAGAWRGLHSCGVYPYNVWTATCGAYGLSIGNPFLSGLAGRTPGTRVYSIKSWADEVVCYGGCTVGGVHSSQLPGEAASYTVSGEYFVLRQLSLGASYDGNYYRADVDDPNWNGSVDLESTGWKFFVRGSF